jgi:murein DD-endopeptidase MepM/ murein hydrolase activator NlpD
MAQDQEFYALIVAPSAKSKLRKVRISLTLIRSSLIVLAAIAIVSLYGLFRFAQHSALQLQMASISSENEQLRRENDAFRANYDRLNNRIAVVEDMSQNLAREMRNEATEDGVDIGQGGPDSRDNMPEFEKRTEELEREIRQMADLYRDEQLKLSSVPAGWPVNGFLTDGYGIRNNPFGGGGVEGHEGQDIAAAFGSPVKSTADGLVVYAASRSGYGNIVVIYHGDGISTRFGHLSQIEVQPGQRVRRGDEIGKVGSTGRSTGPHCHYEVRLNNQPIDPMQYAQ